MKQSFPFFFLSAEIHEQQIIETAAKTQVKDTGERKVLHELHRALILPLPTFVNKQIKPVWLQRLSHAVQIQELIPLFKVSRASSPVFAVQFLASEADNAF